MEYQLLAGLGDTEQRAILSSARRRRFGRNEVVFHEGDPGDTVHLIAKGKVAVKLTVPSGDVVTLTILGAGGSFGEQVLFAEGARRTATVSAMEVTETMAITSEEFHQLRREHPAITEVLLEQLGGRMRSLSADLAEALYAPADRRVWRRVLELDDLYSGADVPVTQEDLATMAGTTRSTVNRVLQPEVDAGLLELGRGRLRVLDRAALAARVG